MTSQRQSQQSESGPPAAPKPPKIWSAFRFRPNPLPWRRSIGAALVTGAVVFLGWRLGHFDWGAWAFMGAFTSIYVTPAPYAKRAVTLFWVALGLAAAMALTSLAAVSWWTTALALGIIGAGATLVTGAWSVPLPASLMFILIACITAALPVDPALTPLRVGFALFGGAVAWGAGMAGGLFHPHRPEVLLVRQAFARVARYWDEIGTPRAMSAQYDAQSAINQAEQALAGNSDHPRLELLLRKAQTFLRIGTRFAEHRQEPVAAKWTRALRAIERHVAERPLEPQFNIPTSAQDVWEARIQRELRHTASLLRQHLALMHAIPPFPRVPVAEHFRQALGKESLVRPAVWRMGIAVTLATVVSRLLGNPHPYWVPLTCAAVLQGTTVVVMAQRSIQRALGTVVGLFFAWLLLAQHPTALQSIGLMMSLQFLMLLLIVGNYGISVVFLTALALVVISAEIHPVPHPLIMARLFDTVVGAAIGFLAALLLWPRASSSRLPERLADTLHGEGELVGLALAGNASEDRVNQARRRVATSLVNLRTLYDAALGEMPRLVGMERLWTTVAAVGRLGFLSLALAASDKHEAAAPDQIRSWRHAFDQLAKAADSGTAPESWTPPQDDRHGAMRRQLQELAQSLSRQD